MVKVGLHFNIRPGLDRESFIAGFSVGANLNSLNPPPGTFSSEEPFVKIQMDCGEEYFFNTPLEIPTNTLSCICGDPDHLIVMWTTAEVQTH